MDLIDSYLILKVKNKETRQKIKKLMSQPDFFRYGETDFIYYVQSTEQKKYYRLYIENNGIIKCECPAYLYGHKKCIHCSVVEILLYLKQN